MKKIILLITFFSIGIHALPDCPSDALIWNNCFGTLTYPNGNEYVGEFKDGKRNGQGTYTFANGNEYVGEFKDGNLNGKGTYTFADGSKYVGEFKDGKYHGQGTFTYASGKKEVGYYINNEYVPEICEGMGLIKGTESFGGCILKLINDL